MNDGRQGKPIDTREEFIVFVQALAQDFRDNRESWENRDIPRFLDAMGAWVADMDGYYLNQGEAMPAEPTWKVLSDILQGARVYE